MNNGQLNRMWANENKHQPIVGQIYCGNIWGGSKWHPMMGDKFARIVELDKKHASDLIFGRKARAILKEK